MKIKKYIKHIILTIILLLAIIYMWIGNNGIIRKEKYLIAKDKFDKAMTEYSEGKYTCLEEALKTVEGYTGTEEENGLDKVKIDGQEIITTHTENTENTETDKITENLENVESTKEEEGEENK